MIFTRRFVRVISSFEGKKTNASSFKKIVDFKKGD